MKRPLGGPQDQQTSSGPQAGSQPATSSTMVLSGDPSGPADSGAVLWTSVQLALRGNVIFWEMVPGALLGHALTSFGRQLKVRTLLGNVCEDGTFNRTPASNRLFPRRGKGTFQTQFILTPGRRSAVTLTPCDLLTQPRGPNVDVASSDVI